MACMTSGASSVTLQSLYWRSSDNFSVPAESSRVNWCSPARRLEDEILESRSLFKGRWRLRHVNCDNSPHKGRGTLWRRHALSATPSCAVSRRRSEVVSRKRYDG